MAKTLTYQDLIDYARTHYTRGGDIVAECWDEPFFREYTEMFGPITKSKALSIFRNYKARQDDIEATIW